MSPTDLFAASASPESIPLEGADVSFLKELSLPVPPNELLKELVKDIPWRSEEVVVWGKRFVQPRLVAWFGDPGKGYTYSGVKLTPLPWTDRLLEIRRSVEDVTLTTFNSVLLNLYRDHRDSMGFHSDDEPELGLRPVIASLSLGAERTFILKSKTNPALKPVRLKLESGSLLLMRGDTQRNWKHGIDKETRPCGPRVNLTFRRIGLD